MAVELFSKMITSTAEIDRRNAKMNELRLWLIGGIIPYINPSTAAIYKRNDKITGAAVVIS